MIIKLIWLWFKIIFKKCDNEPTSNTNMHTGTYTNICSFHQCLYLVSRGAETEQYLTHWKVHVNMYTHSALVKAHVLLYQWLFTLQDLLFPSQHIYNVKLMNHFAVETTLPKFWILSLSGPVAVVNTWQYSWMLKWLSQTIILLFLLLQACG